MGDKLEAKKKAVASMGVEKTHIMEKKQGMLWESYGLL